MAYLLFRNFHFRQYFLVVQVAFWADVAFQAEVPLGLVEVRRFLCTSIVSADSVLCNFDMEGSSPYDFYNPLPGDFPSWPSALYAQETQHLAPSLFELSHEVY
jgi:hypothetical protein